MKLLACTPDPEKLVCLTARNDYYSGNITDDDFETVMAPVSGDTINEKMETLINKLMLRGHWGPWEHPQITVWFKCSRACMGQITRHRHASFDIQSMRYVNLSDMTVEDFCWPQSFTANEIKARDGGKRKINMYLEDRKRMIGQAYTTALRVYRQLVEAGVPKEDARMVLPIGTQINVTMSMNVRSALHILNMRGAGDAQWEIRDLSAELHRILSEHLPITMSNWDLNRTAIRKQRLSP